MKRRKLQHQMDIMGALLLFGVYAVCVLAVLLTGAEAYRRLTQRDREAYDRRTLLQYVATRVRQADSLEGIGLEDFSGTSALVLREGDYVTRVYCYEGYLMELYTSEEDPMGPGDGERIMAAGGLEMSLEDGLLSVTAAGTAGEESTLLLSLRSGEGGGA